jgi:phosphoglycerate-specific signal transduction histidine kinase
MPVSKRKVSAAAGSVEAGRVRVHSEVEKQFLHAEKHCQEDFAFYKAVRAMKNSMDMYLGDRARVLRDDPQSLLLIDAHFAVIDRRFKLIRNKFHALKSLQTKSRIPAPCVKVRLFSVDDGKGFLEAQIVGLVQSLYRPIYDLKQLADKVRKVYKLKSYVDKLVAERHDIDRELEQLWTIEEPYMEAVRQAGLADLQVLYGEPDAQQLAQARQQREFAKQQWRLVVGYS